MTSPIFLLTFISGLGSAVVAGIFFTFSAFIMRALARLSSAQGITAMQSINVAVINRWFFAAFFGTAACCLVLAILCFFRSPKPISIYLLVGSLLYLLGTILVTIIFNVPLNNSLAAVDPTSADPGHVWTNYVKSWTAWNHVRTTAALAAAASFGIALCHAGSSSAMTRSKTSTATKSAMLPLKPEDWPQVFEQRFNAGDLDAVMALYEPDARFVARSGEVLIGHERIREALGKLIGAQTQFRSRVVRAVTVADVAQLSTDFEGTATDDSGKTVAIRNKAIEVLRRQPAGDWKLIMGDPNGRE